DLRKDLESPVDAGVEQFLLAARGAAEHEVGHQAGMAGVAYAQTQAVEIVAVAELGDDVAQAVVATVAAAFLEPGGARGKIEFVVGHQNRLRLDAEEASQCCDRLAAAVHVRGGDQQTNVPALMAELAAQAEILLVERQTDLFAIGQALNEKGPGVVPRLVVFRAWITQANDQLYGSHAGALP